MYHLSRNVITNLFVIMFSLMPTAYSSTSDVFELAREGNLVGVNAALSKNKDLVTTPQKVSYY